MTHQPLLFWLRHWFQLRHIFDQLPAAAGKDERPSIRLATLRATRADARATMSTTWGHYSQFPITSQP